MNEDLSGVMRRIAKLLAIAQDPRANSEEASAAAGMAERIMRKYQIDNVDAVSAELQQGLAESFDSVFVGGTLDLNAENVKSCSGWAGILAVPVAELNACQARYSRDRVKGKCIQFSGYKGDVGVCKYIYEYIVTNMAAAAKRYMKENGCTRSETESFRRGFVNAVCAKLRKEMADKQREMQQAATSRDLVVVKENAVAKHFGDVNYSKRSSRSASRSGYSEGYDQGSQFDPNRRGVGSNGGSNTQRIEA